MNGFKSELGSTYRWILDLKGKKNGSILSAMASNRVAWKRLTLVARGASLTSNGEKCKKKNQYRIIRLSKYWKINKKRKCIEKRY